MRTNERNTLFLLLLAASAVIAGHAIPALGEDGAIPDCATQAVYGQAPAAPGTPGGISASETGEYLLFESFAGLTAPVGQLTWWGFGRLPTAEECDLAPRRFRIEFRAPGGDLPGEVTDTFEVFAAATPTAMSTFDKTVLQFSAVLPRTVDLSAGWVSIAGNGGTSCFFNWYYSVEGDGASAGSFNGSSFSGRAGDLAFCLGVAEEAPVAAPHSADQDGDRVISLSELLRVIQFYNAGGIGCDGDSEDGFSPGAMERSCAPHASDYAPADWRLSLSELLRAVQFYNAGACIPCAGGEDGYCPEAV